MSTEIDINKAKFGKSNRNFNKNSHEHNVFFLQASLNYANDLLRVKGEITLNEVREMIGLPEFVEGDYYGWSLAKGSQFVDFGLAYSGSLAITFNAIPLDNK